MDSRFRQTGQEKRRKGKYRTKRGERGLLEEGGDQGGRERVGMMSGLLGE